MIDRQRLMWELSEADGDAGGTVPSDDELRAYRARELGEVETRRIEWRLGRSEAARARLVELSGARIAAPSARTRRIVLGQEAARRSWRQAIPWRAAALVAAALVAAAMLREARRDVELGAFEVRVEALAVTRSAAGFVEALPQTAVRVVVESETDQAVPGLEYALYRLESDRLERVPSEVATYRGGAILAAPAERLVGAAPGTREFYVLVAPGALPDSLTPVSLAPAAALAEASGGRAWAQSLTILDHDSNGGVAW